MVKYVLEFILSVPSASPETVRNAITEFADSLEIIEAQQGDNQKARDFKINMLTDNPTVVFDACAQFGRIKSVKIEEQ
jgi:dihydroxyacetone kinase-like predicted kinase